jgi:putative ABC transport system permease protein
VIWVDPDFIKTYDIEMLSGEVWDSHVVSDMKSIILNETALSTFGIDDPREALNHRMILENDTFSIAGVMKDYYWNSLKSANVPIIFSPREIVRHTFSIRLSTTDYRGSIAAIESIFRNAFPGNPIEYYFLDDFFNQHYKEDQNFGKMFTGFALFAIIISCLGLFGLTSFTTDKKQREISIRKVLGASTGSIISLLSREFLTMVFGASLFSIPIMWYVTARWLASFAFRMQLTWDIFVVPTALLTILCLATVSTSILRGAGVNPARVLKTE